MCNPFDVCARHFIRILAALAVALVIATDKADWSSVLFDFMVLYAQVSFYRITTEKNAAANGIHDVVNAL